MRSQEGWPIAMIPNRSVPTDVVLPHIDYRDVEQAVSWLNGASGFVEHYRYGNPVSGAQMRAGKAWLMVNQAGRRTSTPKELGFGTQSLTIFIEDVESHFKHAKFSRVSIVEVHETEYANSSMARRILMHWLFSRRAKDVNPEQ